MEQKTVERVLLPKNVKPIHYSINLKPDLNAFTFTGTEHVTLQVLSKTSTVTLNALDIKVSSANLGEKNLAKSITHKAEEETIVFEFEKEVEPGNEVVLFLEFSGEINDKLSGFYRSSYEFNGKKCFLGTTQFEPCDARRAFPCWDEPAVKAKFTLTMTGPKDMTFLFNTPPKKEDVNGDLKTVIFEETPIMSTYLVAYCIGHFECVETVSSEGIIFRVWTVPGKKDMGKFALDCGAKILTFFSKFYGIPYPLKKQDMIAVPDFSFGAMENWGLITYRETALLCDEKTASFAAKARVAYVVGHELAHQWFGNLVTMEWWKELWLNEGFATFMGTAAVDSLFPDWKVWTQFVSDYIFRALNADSLRNSHPIEVDVSVARKVDEIFDAISYCKGASVILMIERALGKEAFQKGLNIYLNRFKYGNAVTEDLWQALSEGSGKNVTKIMDTWVKKIGFPVVSVEKTAEKGKYKITQNRYLAAGAPTEEENKTIWPLLVSISTHSHPEPVVVEISERSCVVSISVQNEDEWVKINSGQSGFFRTKYSDKMLENLGKAVISLQLPPEDRAGIQNDAYALVRSGDIPLSQYLHLLRSYVNETDPTVWVDLCTNLLAVTKILDGHPAENLLKQFTLHVLGNIRSLGWDSVKGEAETVPVLRGTILGMIGRCGDKEVVEEAHKRFKTFLDDPKSLSANLQATVYGIVMRQGGEKEFNQLKEIYKKATVPAEKTTALRAIGLITNPELIKSGLEYMMSEEVKSQDRYILISALTSTPVGRDICFDYVRKNWDKIKASFTHNLLPTVISYTCGSFATEEKLKEMQQFFADHREHGTEMTIAQTEESIQSNIKFLANHSKEVGEWLTKNFS